MTQDYFSSEPINSKYKSFIVTTSVQLEINGGLDRKQTVSVKVIPNYRSVMGSRCTCCFLLKQGFIM